MASLVLSLSLVQREKSLNYITCTVRRLSYTELITPIPMENPERTFLQSQTMSYGHPKRTL
jgi:hypothetical protein